MFEKEIQIIDFMKGMLVVLIIVLAAVILLNIPNPLGNNIEQKILDSDPAITSCQVSLHDFYYDAFCKFYNNQTTEAQMLKLVCIEDNEDVWCKPDGFMIKAKTTKEVELKE